MPTCKSPSREQQDIPGCSLRYHVSPKVWIIKPRQSSLSLPFSCLQLRSESPGLLPSPVLVQSWYQLYVWEGGRQKQHSNPLKQLKGWQGNEALSIFRTTPPLHYDSSASDWLPKGQPQWPHVNYLQHPPNSSCQLIYISQKHLLLGCTTMYIRDHGKQQRKAEVFDFNSWCNQGACIRLNNEC